MSNPPCSVCDTPTPPSLMKDGQCSKCRQAALVAALAKAAETAAQERERITEINERQEEVTRISEEERQATRKAKEDKFKAQDEEREFNKKHEAAKERARRELARRRFLPFVMEFTPEYTPGWVHKDIAQRLEKFSDDVANKESPRLMLFMPPRHGKLLADETPVYTVDGWSTHGELQPGDMVYHPSGVPTRVKAVSPPGDANVAMTFTGGETIWCHENHEWAVRDMNSRRRDTVMEAREFYREITPGRGRYRNPGRRIQLLDAIPPGRTYPRGRFRLPDVAPPQGAPLEVMRQWATRLPDKHTTQFKRARVMYVEKAELHEFAPRRGRCIEVDAEDGLYVVGRTFVPTHNSQLTSKTFGAWHLGRFPRHEFIGCSYSSSLANQFSRHTRNIMKDPYYAKVFPGVALDPDNQSVDSWLTSAGGGYAAAGVQGSITGRGAHCLVIDDPLKNREDADSQVTRSAIYDWYTSTAYTRLAPGGGILIICTRWHDDDLAGRLITDMQKGGEQWEIINYPAVAEEDEPYRRKGEALHPERYDLDALKRIRRAVGPRDWAALYQQTPVAQDGALFTNEMIQYYKQGDMPPRDSMMYYCAWDFAIGQKQYNDFTVGITVGIDYDENIWLVDMRRGRWGSLEIVEQLLDMQKRWGAQAVGVERGQIQMTLGPILDKRIRERKQFGFLLKELRPGKTDKVARSSAIQGRMQQGMVRIPESAPWAVTLVNELLRFPAGVNDDCVDVLSYIGIMINDMIARPPPRPKRKKSWRDNLRTNPNKRSAMAA